MNIDGNFISNCVSSGFIREFLESVNAILLIQVGNRKSTNLDFILITYEDTLSEAKEKANLLHLKSKVGDDCIQFEFFDHLWSFAIYTRPEFDDKISQIFSLRIYGEIRGWAMGYWLPEGFLIDIMNSDFCYGHFEMYGQLKADLNKNWGRYKQELIEKIKDEILTKEKLRQKYPEGSFWFERLSSDMSLANVRLGNLSLDNNATGFHRMTI